jgi:aminoglycoside phosphotransferase (APT) family kinase protein
MAARTSSTIDSTTTGRLEAWLARELDARSVRLADARLLAGGAVQENWRIDVAVDGGARTGSHTWVLRADPSAPLPIGLDRASEFAVVAAAFKAGVRVAEPIARCADAGVIGRPFLVQTLITGEAQARRIVRDPDLARFGPALARECGAELARIHAIRVPRADLAQLPIPLVPPARAEVAKLRKTLDGASEPRPALEYIARWLDAHAPPPPPALALVHGDFRTGNYMVEGGRLTGVLDWEFAHWGDGVEDLGWFCARCWRAGNDTLHAGGIAARADLLAGYNALADRRIAESELAYWEILGAARWAAIAVLQGDRYRISGDDRLEPALTGLMPPEMEIDALDLIALQPTHGGR